MTNGYVHTHGEGAERNSMRRMLFPGFVILTALLLFSGNVAADNGEGSSMPTNLIIVAFIAIIAIIVVLFVIIKRKKPKKAMRRMDIIKIEMVLNILREEKGWGEESLERAKRALEKVNELREGA